MVGFSINFLLIAMILNLEIRDRNVLKYANTMKYFSNKQWIFLVSHVVAMVLKKLKTFLGVIF